MNVLLRLFLVLLTTTLAAGCDDDDSPTAPSASSPSLFVLGSVSASGGSLSGWIEAWDVEFAAGDTVVLELFEADESATAARTVPRSSRPPSSPSRSAASRSSHGPRSRAPTST